MSILPGGRRPVRLPGLAARCRMRPRSTPILRNRCAVRRKVALARIHGSCTAKREIAGAILYKAGRNRSPESMGGSYHG